MESKANLGSCPHETYSLVREKDTSYLITNTYTHQLCCEGRTQGTWHYEDIGRAGRDWSGMGRKRVPESGLWAEGQGIPMQSKQHVQRL